MPDIELARKEAIRVLCLAQAQDRIPVEAFEARLERIKHAPNQATLEAILADLEPLPSSTAVVPAWEPAPAYPAHIDAVSAPISPAEFIRIASVFGSSKRAGSWTVPLEIQARVLLGEMTLDLRDAVFVSDVLDIELHGTLGSFTLIVPVGTQVENEVEEVLTSSTHSTRNTKGAGPNGLLVRLRGRAVMASIEVKEKFPTGTNAPTSFFQRLLGGGGS